MNFFHSETYEEHADRIGRWHKKFLWFPTRVDAKNTRWLEFVWRRATAYYGLFDRSSTEEYECLPYSRAKPIDDKILESRVKLTIENFTRMHNFFSYEQKQNIKVVRNDR